MFNQAEERVRLGVERLHLIVERIGAAIIAIGILVALRGLLSHLRGNRNDEFNPVRLAFARYPAMALEFQLAADIVSTTVAPNGEQLGKLVTVAAIRTGFNFFLMREIREERGSPH